VSSPRYRRSLRQICQPLWSTACQSDNSGRKRASIAAQKIASPSTNSCVFVVQFHEGKADPSFPANLFTGPYCGLKVLRWRQAHRGHTTRFTALWTCKLHNTVRRLRRRRYCFLYQGFPGVNDHPSRWLPGCPATPDPRSSVVRPHWRWLHRKSVKAGEANRRTWVREALTDSNTCRLRLLRGWARWQDAGLSMSPATKKPRSVALPVTRIGGRVLQAQAIYRSCIHRQRSSAVAPACSRNTFIMIRNGDLPAAFSAWAIMFAPPPVGYKDRKVLQ